MRARTTVLAVVALALVVPAAAQAATVPESAARPAVAAARAPVALAPAADVRRVRISLRTWARGLVEPIAVVTLPDGRLLVAEQRGLIRVVSRGRVLSRPYLDLRSKVLYNGNERGLLGLVLDPDFTHHRRLWVTYTGKGSGSALGALTLARVTAPSVGSATATASSVRSVVSIPHGSAPNHNGGSVQFLKDGLLTWSTGDAGEAGDNHDNARRDTVLLGKILRLDVRRICAPRLYCVPAGNPRVGGRPSLVWMKGLRNPWRTSVDPLTGDLWIGDVGQDAVEEIDRVPVGSGKLDFGWSCREGNDSFIPSRCTGRTMTAPVITVRHPAAEAIIGGVMYRGAGQPLIRGVYFYADYVGGSVWGYDGHRSARVAVRQGITAFGATLGGDPLVTTYDGTVARLVASAA